MKLDHTLLLNMFNAMLEKLGPSHWWPAETPFEVALGAILTQNTNWLNVEKALQNIKEENLLHPQKLASLPDQTLADLIRPAGYFRVKSDRIKEFLSFLRTECMYSFHKLELLPMEELRTKLLAVKGIGPETADSILLYALNKPTFVVDTYTKRILSRHNLTPATVAYETLRSLFMDALPHDVLLFNEFHALLDRTGKTWCKKGNQQCETCPLLPFLNSH